MSADHTARKQRGKPFKRGQSGNPAGRPKGLRNKATMAALALLDGEAEALTRKAVEAALAGDMQAIRICMERIVPPRKESPVVVKLPRLSGAADLPAFLAKLTELVGTGELTPGEAQALSGLGDAFRKALELTDIEKRLAALEKTIKEKP